MFPGGRSRAEDPKVLSDQEDHRRLKEMAASGQLLSITLCLQDILKFQKYLAVPLKSLNVQNHH